MSWKQNAATHVEAGVMAILCFFRSKRGWIRRAFAFMVFFSLGSGQSIASPAGEIKAGSISLEDLEILVWLSEPEALDSLEKATTRKIQEDPGSSLAHCLLAQVHINQFKQNPAQLRLLRQASELGQQALELNPDLDFAYIISAQVLDIMGYHESALASLEADSKISFKATWRTFFAKGFLQSGRAPSRITLSHYSESLRLANSSKEVLIPAIIRTIQASYVGKSLVNELESWSQRLPHPKLELSLGLALKEDGQFKEALAIYQKLGKSREVGIEARIHQGILMARQLGKHKEASKILSEISSSETNKLSDEHLATIKTELARLSLQHSSKPQSTRQLFIAAVNLSRNPMEAIASAHRAYESAQRLEDFVGLLDELSENVSGSGYLYALRGEILSESLSKHEKAIDSFSSAITLDPERSEFYNGMGLAYYRMQDLERALALFNQATKLDPQDATARYNEACVLAILGRSSEALGSLKEAIDLDPRLQQTAKLDNDFSKMRILEQFQNLTNSNPVAIGP